MAVGPVATDQKKATRRNAHIVIIDESGLLMAPLVRRTWAPRGHPPTLVQQGHRGKVSVAAALWLTPLRDRLGLFFLTLPNGYFNSLQVADFMDALMQELAGPVVALWDRGSIHQGDPIRALMNRFGTRLILERLPPYAPNLSPVESLWRWLKYDRLCNFAPLDVDQLNDMVLTELSAIQNDQVLLRSFFYTSALPLPRALLS
jgi:transposase